MKALTNLLQLRKTLCFMDLEGTQFTHEMIAIGAIKVEIRKDGSVRKIHKGMYTLVKAKNRIGKVVTDLTGITEADLREKGVSFRVAIDMLKKYMGHDYSKCLFVTFGNHDFRIMAQSLAHNLDVKKEDVEIVIKHQFDFAEFANNYVKDEKNNNLSLANMLKVFNIDFEGAQHNALADTLNLVYLYDAFIKNREILKNEYRKTLGMYRHLPQPIHQAIEKLANKENVSAEEFEKFVDDSLE
ncbi:MAG: exonuclease domain-containing protein [Bacilli bacterium]|nr:exonuclease domain-containing protein [Bacilli bacterium]